MTGRLRRVSKIALVLALVLGTAIVVALATDGSRRGYLDPEGIDELGARAVVQLLDGQGVNVTEVRTTADAVRAAEPGATVLVTIPDLLVPTQIDSLLATGADLVLIAPTVTVAEFSDRIEHVGGDFVEVLDPGCDMPEARRAGAAHLGDVVYTAEPPATTCYPVGGDGASVVVDTTAQGARLVVIGTAQPLVNRYLDEQGNAALALGVLGHNRELIWYRPTLEEVAAADTSVTDLLPDWVGPVAIQLGIAALLAALWQGRRLGRVVSEKLPVVIRASETTEGLARLYRRGRAREHAAATLRESATAKLRARLGLPRSADADSIIAAVATRSDRSQHELTALLNGAAPSGDPALVALADDLDALIEEVLTR